MEVVNEHGQCVEAGLPAEVQLEISVLNGEKYKEVRGASAGACGCLQCCAMIWLWGHAVAMWCLIATSVQQDKDVRGAASSRCC